MDCFVLQHFGQFAIANGGIRGLGFRLASIANGRIRGLGFYSKTVRGIDMLVAIVSISDDVTFKGS